jgi:hypothetical protein
LLAVFSRESPRTENGEQARPLNLAVIVFITSGAEALYYVVW